MAESGMADLPKASDSTVVAEIPKAGPSKEKGTKRKQPDDSEDPTPPPPISNRAEVVVYQPKNRLPRKPATVPATPSFSPSQSFSLIDLPPPSPIGTSSSLPSLSSSSHLLEIAILKSQLDAANESLRRERERSQQELQVQRDQFDRERSAYQDYIKSLESERHN
jgi:hypothetical protein